MAGRCTSSGKPFVAFAFQPGTGPLAARYRGMEYEIRDGEDALFDSSTNPSLEHRDPQPAKLDKRKLQKAELIPEEEEHQLA